MWESPLANGIVPTYNNFDAQVNLRLPKWETTVKLGEANVFNHRYIQYAAGPIIGGLYYVSLVFDQNFR